jgi:hypothetical protein
MKIKTFVNSAELIAIAGMLICFGAVGFVVFVL